eukprot:CAMPEP_0119553160 /NCGR_PEP_ID=MMETSP1352-20130426/5975_1 /TAXON_ID=265584 /ORGANISM="Stauroneis constricta, Strain CCMP1120" /LENGTH=1125 /DNA_ID=CAMNT_0007599515 /DNA_START=61 /DNA_END=3438 /DNA_ORIENTATION=+
MKTTKSKDADHATNHNNHDTVEFVSEVEEECQEEHGYDVTRLTRPSNGDQQPAQPSHTDVRAAASDHAAAAAAAAMPLHERFRTTTSRNGDNDGDASSIHKKDATDNTASNNNKNNNKDSKEPIGASFASSLSPPSSPIPTNDNSRESAFGRIQQEASKQSKSSMRRSRYYRSSMIGAANDGKAKTEIRDGDGKPVLHDLTATDQIISHRPHHPGAGSARQQRHANSMTRPGAVPVRGTSPSSMDDRTYTYGDDDDDGNDGMNGGGNNSNFNSNNGSSSEVGNRMSPFDLDDIIQATMVVEDEEADRNQGNGNNANTSSSNNNNNDNSGDIEALQEELKRFRNQPQVRATAVPNRTQPNQHLKDPNASDPMLSGEYTENAKQRKTFLYAIGCIIVLAIVAVVIGVTVALTATGSNGNKKKSSIDDPIDAVSLPPTSTTTTPPPTAIELTQPPTEMTAAPTTSTPTTSPTRPPFDGAWKEYPGNEYNIEGTVGSLSLASSVTECVDHCATEDSLAVRYESNQQTVDDQGNEIPNCICYSTISCVMPWGDNVDTGHMISSMQYTKYLEPLCANTFCDEHPNDYLCYTNQLSNQQQHMIYGESLALVASTSVRVSADDDIRCIKFCASRDADVVKHQRFSDDPANCHCYNAMDCFLGWGDSVNPSRVVAASIHTKRRNFYPTCDRNYCELFPNDPLCFTGNTASITQNGTLYGPNMRITNSVKENNQLECLSLCKDYPAVQHFQDPKTLDWMCQCVDSVECVAPWENDFITARKPVGVFFMKQEWSTCPMMHCQYDPNSPYCFEQSRTRDAIFHGDNLAITDASRQEYDLDCISHCSNISSSILFHGNRASGDNCYCYENVDCMLGWSSNVDPNAVEYGLLFTKEKPGACNGTDFCTLHPDDYRCFTGNRNPYQGKQLDGANLQQMKSLDVSNERECMMECEGYQAARYFQASPLLPAETLNCACYDNAECLLPWGQKVSGNLIPQGWIFTNEHVADCSETYCDRHPDDHLCFTGNKHSLQSFTLYHDDDESIVMLNSTNAANEIKCLTFCEGYDGVQYIQTERSPVVNRPNCQCFNSVNCRLEYGNSVKRRDLIPIGSVYAKKPLSICADIKFCDVYPLDVVCTGES